MLFRMVLMNKYPGEFKFDRLDKGLDFQFLFERIENYIDAYECKGRFPFQTKTLNNYVHLSEKTVNSSLKDYFFCPELSTFLSSINDIRNNYTYISEFSGLIEEHYDDLDLYYFIKNFSVEYCDAANKEIYDELLYGFYLIYKRVKSLNSDRKSLDCDLLNAKHDIFSSCINNVGTLKFNIDFSDSHLWNILIKQNYRFYLTDDDLINKRTLHQFSVFRRLLFTYYYCKSKYNDYNFLLFFFQIPELLFELLNNSYIFLKYEDFMIRRITEVDVLPTYFLFRNLLSFNPLSLKGLANYAIVMDMKMGISHLVSDEYQELGSLLSSIPFYFGGCISESDYDDRRLKVFNSLRELKKSIHKYWKNNEIRDYSSGILDNPFAYPIFCVDDLSCEEIQDLISSLQCSPEFLANFQSILRYTRAEFNIVVSQMSKYTMDEIVSYFPYSFAIHVYSGSYMLPSAKFYDYLNSNFNYRISSSEEKEEFWNSFINIRSRYFDFSRQDDLDIEDRKNLSQVMTYIDSYLLRSKMKKLLIIYEGNKKYSYDISKIWSDLRKKHKLNLSDIKKILQFRNLAKFSKSAKDNAIFFLADDKFKERLNYYFEHSKKFQSLKIVTVNDIPEKVALVRFAAEDSNLAYFNNFPEHIAIKLDTNKEMNWKIHIDHLASAEENIHSALADILTMWQSKKSFDEIINNMEKGYLLFIDELLSSYGKKFILSLDFDDFIHFYYLSRQILFSYSGDNDFKYLDKDSKNDNKLWTDFIGEEIKDLTTYISKYASTLSEVMEDFQ